MASGPTTVILRHLREREAPGRSEQASDRELLLRFVADRDEAAFAALVRRRGPMVLRVCQRVLGHRQDSEDAFQATFLVLARKAASTRWNDSVAGWLHGVAHHLALKARAAAARRVAHERRARPRPAAAPLADVTVRELRAVLDEELARLPAKYRAPVVLCCLEGAARDEAAQQLGWDLQLVKSRLDYGRELLRARLARRGLTLSAALAGATLGRSGRAALPVALVSDTSKAAVLFAAGKTAAGTLPAEVAALADGMGKAVPLGGVKIAAVLLLAVSVAAGAGALGQREAAARPSPAPPEAAKPSASKPTSEPAFVERGDSVTFRGRVLDPDGKPFRGAAITVGWGWVCGTCKPIRPAVQATSGPDGDFRLTVAKSAVETPSLLPHVSPYHFSGLTVVAAAKGHGPGWAQVGGFRSGAAGGRPLRLARDDVPIRGRVLDLQGRPVAGAHVRVHHLEALDGQSGYLPMNSWSGLTPDVTTDREGRFVIRGVGRDRAAHLHLAGPTVEHKKVRVTTDTAANATVDVVLGPTKPIEGTVRATDTGRPLAGVLVCGGDSGGAYTGIHTVTDEQGRYRLLGMPKAGRYEVTAYPKRGQPYLVQESAAGDSEGLKPIAVDFRLARGVAVRARLIDKATGKPVRGGVMYLPLGRDGQDNPFLYPDKDNIFHIVALPGPGAIVGRSFDVPCVPRSIAPADERAYPAAGKTPFLAGGLQGYTDLFHSYRVFDARDTARPLDVDVELDPGRALSGILIGPDSRPVSGAVAFGLTHDPVNANNVSYRNDPAYRARVESQVLKTDGFTVRGLDGRGTRALTFLHEDRKLIANVVVSPDADRPLRVRLEPWGSLTGRLVGAGGKPLRDARVQLVYPGGVAAGLQAPGVSARSDGEGRFRVEGLIPGLLHELVLSAETGLVPAGPRGLKELSTRAGEARDLGDIAVKPVKKGS